MAMSVRLVVILTVVLLGLLQLTVGKYIYAWPVARDVRMKTVNDDQFKRQAGGKRRCHTFGQSCFLTSHCCPGLTCRTYHRLLPTRCYDGRLNVTIPNGL